ncbi:MULTISPECIES: tRNA epoxyqueuosine(34) reductase QueG [unclassified Leptospira]|uniref:tRNA epoxyqueuosine(34) reductase QueG n=1 Tax=unclassified Leptospira TaxID=2633828 RepID=UPI0002BE52F9|nr:MULTISPECIES: tRNA epoxyqueuosine(34) reductase QueG [unclassified Leptospira]EMJ96903.1 epoxyqueuosine reductase [Leptospira sp. B5-022]MCR1792539.1 tRNA epoxyqueuosine(34) reductase QueG [Leptospira sp. id769339]
MLLESKELLDELRDIAEESGFQLFGVAPAFVPSEDKENILHWVREGRHGNMDWYPKNMNLRLELEGLGFKPESVIALGALYNDPEYENLDLPYRFSRYAMGEDYHSVLRKKASGLLEFLRKKYPNQKFRQGVDSLPVPEKILAREAGLGWIGKNTNLIHEEYGSFFFISLIFTDLPINFVSVQAKDRCGTCRACIDSCPTKALEPYKIDARKCISYKTIEDRSETVNSLYGWVYGCDICQEICPWNQVKARKKGWKTEIDEFKIRDLFKKENLSDLDEKEFKNYFQDSAVNRISYKQMRRNLTVWERDSSKFGR